MVWMSGKEAPTLPSPAASSVSGRNTSMNERIKKQLDFSLEIDKEKNVFRQTHLSGHGRNENDAEHEYSVLRVPLIRDRIPSVAQSVPLTY